MAHVFEIAGGSVAGRDHRQGIPRNRQDAFAIRTTDYGSIAIVCDGCGSGEHSEVGAGLAVQLLANALEYYLTRGAEPGPEFLARVAQEVESMLHLLAKGMGDSLHAVVNDYFLFTTVGMVSAAETTLFFYLGDGVIVINDETTILDSGPNNAPDYFGYRLLGKRLKFEIAQSMSTDAVERFLLGSDGIMPAMQGADRLLPGTQEAFGPISQFWENSKYFKPGSIGIARRLNLAARDWPRQSDSGRLVKDSGFLSDDATMIVGRRIPIENDKEA